MTPIFAFGALALLFSASFAQSSYPTAPAASLIATEAPYPMPNSTVAYGPTGTAASSTSIDQALSSSYASLADSSSAAVLAEAGSGSCGPATVTETAYQTIYTTVTPSVSPSNAEARPTEASTATSTIYQTIQVVNATSTIASSGTGLPSSSATELGPYGNGTSTGDLGPTSTSVLYQTAIVSPVPKVTGVGKKHRRAHRERL